MKCLESNKEDTANALEVIGELQEEKDLLKLQLNNIRFEFDKYKEYAEDCVQSRKDAWVIGNIMMPIMSIPVFITGIAMKASGDNYYGDKVLMAGAGVLFGCEIVWNGGFAFHFW